MEHSPLPWTASTSSYELTNTVVAADGFRVAVLIDGNKERPPEEHAANAEFIVRAVNSHAELVKALEDLLTAHHHSRGDEYVDAAYAALQSAKGV